MSEVNLTETQPHIPPKKRRLLTEGDCEIESKVVRSAEVGNNPVAYRPDTMQLVSILRNDIHNKCIALHTRFNHSPDKDAIVLLQKSPFPSDADTLCILKVAQRRLSIADEHQLSSGITKETNPDDANYVAMFPAWDAKSIMNNDVYHRFLVSAGLELVNGVDMTVIHPAEAHHFLRYVTSSRCIVNETPDMYRMCTVPFLAKQPRDLGWVDNILAGTAEQDRVLFADPDPATGFTLVLDYRWNGKRIHELHCLGLVRDLKLTCLRDLSANHVPMLKRILAQGRRALTERYGDSSGSKSTCEDSANLKEDQIMAYLHYPPTFYRLHVHFIHVDAGDASGTRAGRAHLLEEVIRNLELKGDYYATRTLSICLHENSPMLTELRSYRSPSDGANRQPVAADCSSSDM